MLDWLQAAFGTDADLNGWQMALRAVAVFWIALLLIRLSGRRSFGQHSPFDACTTVLLGAILSRAVVGASPFLATVFAATALAVLHRLVGIASVYSERFEALVDGREIVILADGRERHDAMVRALVTPSTLAEAIRKKLGDGGPEAASRAVLERNGDITVIERRPT